MSSNEGEKRIVHYRSCDKILLVGEGDFSFSACLARAFGSAANMVATSLDSRERLLDVYAKAATHLKELEEHGCKVIHEVDVHTMNNHPFLHSELFDKIVFNFPHGRFVGRESDWSQIKIHQELVEGFLESAYHLLLDTGEVHITHKTAHPFSGWGIEELKSDLFVMFADEHFQRSDYPGYINKKGYGRWDHTFRVGACRTFMFRKKSTRKMTRVVYELN